MPWPWTGRTAAGLLSFVSQYIITRDKAFSPFVNNRARQDFLIRASSTEASGILELGNVWGFVQLIFGPCWPMNKLNKNQNIT